jgi:hypothetical protein
MEPICSGSLTSKTFIVVDTNCVVKYVLVEDIMVRTAEIET